MSCVETLSAALGGGAAQAEALCSQFATQSSLQSTNVGLNTLYLVLCGALVFIMHAGFAMVGYLG